MGVNSLLGILSGLGDILGKVFSSIFSWFAKAFIVPIVRGAIAAVVNVVKYMGSVIFLSVSQFLMGLIDFVQILFRSLAGLPSNAGDMSIEMSINNGSGDLLIQMLTSTDVIQAFYATAIVGMFLLIITTIFQMIKVEYTTEGAQNSKTGIIGKSLKSLCNMLIVPLLCIFGVFIGNQVLDLIDTATGGGNNKISGQLWITASSTAVVKPGTFKSAMKEYLGEKTDMGDIYTIGITLGITQGLNDAIASMFGQQELIEVDLGDTNVSKEYVDTVGKNFLACSNGCNYYDVSSIMEYYNPFEVNYLVLIFGAVIIIKCLFYTCFGLIDRLYQCVALFIVMPMVIGMSPVKDSLGSWRGKFMQKALSAYGTVLSLNLFFIIVEVMLNIDISFGSGYNSTIQGSIKGNGNYFIFSTSFMEGLIKSIMVIVGCMMIEKLAGDLGGYFGAGNAMAEGKGLAKEATAGLQKAAQVGVGSAKFVGGMTMKGIKAGAGIAYKVGGGIAHGVSGLSHKAGASMSKRGLNKMMAKTGVSDDQVGDYGAGLELKQEASDKVTQADNNITKAENKKKEAEKVLNSKTSTIAERTAARNTIKKADEDIAKNEEDKKKAEDDVKIADEMINDEIAKNSNVVKVYKKSQKIDEKVAKVSADKAAAGKRKEEREKAWSEAKGNAIRTVTTTKNALGQMYENKFGTQAIFNAVAPKNIQQIQKDYQTALKEGNSTPEGQAMLAALEESKKKAKEESYNKNIGNAMAIKYLNLQQTELILNTTNAKLAQTNFDTNKELSKLNDLLRDAVSKYSAAAEGTEAKSVYANKINSIQEAMIAKNSNIRFSGLEDIKTEAELKVDFKMGDDFMKKMQEQIKKGVKMDKIMDQINEEFKKIGLTDKDTLAKIYKALEELKNQTSGK